jgi:diguanylate cyclase (GGDEF)-like protein/PAS domain S-box-containing protein
LLLNPSTAGETVNKTFGIMPRKSYRHRLRAFGLLLFSPALYAQSETPFTTINAYTLWLLGTTVALVITLLVMIRLRRYQSKLKTSEERLRLSLWGSGDEIWDWDINKGLLHRANGAAGQGLPGYENHSFPPNKEAIHPHDLKRVTELLQQHFDGVVEHFEATYRIKSSENGWIWVLDRGKIVDTDNNDKPLRMTGTVKDIHELKKAEDRLYLFARCMENISDAVVIFDANFNVIDTNPSYTRVTGKQREDVIGKPLELSQYPDSFVNSIKVNTATAGKWFGEIEDNHANGEIYHVELSIDMIRDESGDSINYVAVFSDVTERKAAEEELRKLSNSDPLTGLPNRALFYRNMQRLETANNRHALLVFDLDNFKKINDSLGHQLGDILLCRVAERIQTIVRGQDSVYRLGGDEFAVIIEQSNDIHTITSTAKEVLRVINKPFNLDNHELVVTSSIGVVLFPEDGNDPQTLLRNADTAMYQAKAEGNRYMFFNDSMNKQAVKRLQIETLVRYGLKEDLFCVYYQPKIDIKTGKLAGMEALVRFITPKKGLISPLAFIPVAEETGQIVEIGEVVLNKACADMKRWVDAKLFEGRVAVNLSARQFSIPNLCERIDVILQANELPSYHLELEITEGTVMDSPTDAIEIMNRLRSRGIHLAMDDFGTGYSSLAYLKRFPLNTLKVDKAFIDDILTDEGGNMVDTIVTIAHNLGMSVVAEGVENFNQLQPLIDLNCEVVQGFYYSKPLSAKDFEAFLHAERGKKPTLFAVEDVKKA